MIILTVWKTQNKKYDTKYDTKMKRARKYGLFGVQEKGLELLCKKSAKPLFYGTFGMFLCGFYV